MPTQPLNDFQNGLRRVDFTRAKMENLYAANKIALRDLHSVYEALFIRSVTGFETFLQDQFLAIMNGSVAYKKHRKVAARMTAISSAALVEILLQGRSYVTWLPYDQTVNRAYVYMKEGKPFSDVSEADRLTIKKITTIRNAIAHQSQHAISEFEKKVIAGIPLLPQEKKPAGFLRSTFRAAPKQSRFEFYVNELGRIATFIC